MKLSVVLPAYNAELFINKAIDSVLDQTFKDFEFIIINDGSTDNTLQIIKSYDDNRIVLIDQENKGLAKTLNIGLQKARGEYIARMDADDICMPKRFERQIRFLDSNPKVGLLGTALEVIDEKGGHISYHAPYIGDYCLKKIMKTKGNPFKHPSVMFRREIAIECGGYNELIGKYFEDYFLWNAISQLAEVNNLPEVLLKYRITPGSIMSEFKDKNFDEFVKKIIDKNSFSTEDRKEMDDLLSNIKQNNPKHNRTNRKYNRLERILDCLYLVFGNKAIWMFGVIKKNY